jgi:AcrR family transcriptional regulator
MKMDRRSRKTDERIKNALCFLIAEKGFEGLTVAEIAAEADISRSSFYLHYASISEALYAVEDGIIKRISSIATKDQPSLERMLLEIAESAKDEKEALKALFKACPTHFARKIELIFAPVIRDSPFSKGKKGLENSNYIATFLIDGGLGVFKKWVEEDCATPQGTLLRSFLSFFEQIA